MWKIDDNTWGRKCPSCGDTIEHKGLNPKGYALKRHNQGCRCHPCAAKERIPPSDITRKKLSDCQKGRKFSIEHRKNISNSLVGKQQTEERKTKTSHCVKEAMHRPDVRKRHLDALAETKYLGQKTDKGQLELLDKWNKLGFNLVPNYQVHTDDFLCYIDGYDKEKNVVLEYDTKYHSKPIQQQKDLIRQQRIIDILKPKKFWRYIKNQNRFVEIINTSTIHTQK